MSNASAFQNIGAAKVHSAHALQIIGADRAWIISSCSWQKMKEGIWIQIWNMDMEYMSTSVDIYLTLIKVE